MNPDLIGSNLHERARRLAALSGLQSEELPTADRAWLSAHLESCASCREFAESASETIRSLRTISITADGSLVSATRARLHQRAQELQCRRERLWVSAVCCAAVTLCTTFNTVLLWREFAWLSQWFSQHVGRRWIGTHDPLPSALLELGFLALCLMPAIVAGVVLLARGTYMTDQNPSVLRRF